MGLRDDEVQWKKDGCANKELSYSSQEFRVIEPLAGFQAEKQYYNIFNEGGFCGCVLNRWIRWRHQIGGFGGRQNAK